MKKLAFLLALTTFNLYAATQEPSYSCGGRGFKNTKIKVILSDSGLTLQEKEEDEVEVVKILSHRTVINIQGITGIVVDKDTKRIKKKVFFQLNLNYMRGTIQVEAGTPTGLRETTYPLSCQVL